MLLLSDFSDHLKHTGPDVESGLIVLGGAMLEEPIKEGVPPKMKGSVSKSVERYLVRSCRGAFANLLSRCRLFRSRALLGRRLSERFLNEATICMTVD